MAPQDFRRYQGAPTVVSDIAAAANVFAYQGDLITPPRRSIWPIRCGEEVIHHPNPAGRRRESWRRIVLGELYAATGVPASALREIWQSTAEAGRMASPSDRKHWRIAARRRDRPLHRAWPADLPH